MQRIYEIIQKLARYRRRDGKVNPNSKDAQELTNWINRPTVIISPEHQTNPCPIDYPPVYEIEMGLTV